jgi:hypothetical protein
MAQDPDRAAAKIAARQLGLITRMQARFRAGLTEDQIDLRVATKRWRRVQPGVYAIAGAASTWEQTALAVLLRIRTERAVESKKRFKLEELDDVALSGKSALWVRGVQRLGKPDQHELLAQRRRPIVAKGAVVTTTRSLPVDDIEIVNSIPTLAVPRLCVELCASTLSDVDFIAVLDDLLGPADSGLRREVHARAVALRPGRRGLSRLVQLTSPGAEAAFRSWLERHTCELFLAAGLPAAQWNIELHDDDGKLIGIGDAVWPYQRVVVELDGLRFHAPADQRRKDNRKDRRLAAAEWLVLRYTWLDVMERPGEVVAEVCKVLQSRD